MCRINSTKKSHNIRRHAKRFFAAALIISCLISVIGVMPAYAANSWQVSLRLNQNITGGGYISHAAEFTYSLIPLTDSAPMPQERASDIHTFKGRGIAEVDIGTIIFNSAGVYIYELRCVSGDNRFSVDQRVYSIEVYIINGREAVTLVYASSDRKMPDIVYEHTYRGSISENRHINTSSSDRASVVFGPAEPDNIVEILMPPIPTAGIDATTIIKEVEGNPETASVFTFELKAENPSSPMPDGSVDNVKRISVIGAGKGEFGVWRYEHEGIYRYTVSEVDTNIGGYIYDTNVYTITDEAIRVGEQLLTVRTITDSSGAQVNSLSFINIYTEEDTPAVTLGETGTPLIGPKTGDFSNPALWITLIIISGVLFSLLILAYCKSNSKNKRR